MTVHVTKFKSFINIVLNKTKHFKKMETNITQEGVYTISVGEKTVSTLFIFI